MTKKSNKLEFRYKNKTYYRDLERIHQLLIAPGSKVLEIGCGVGDLLNEVKPSHGVGIEINPEIAQIAKRRHPHLKILELDAELITPEMIEEVDPFDVIIINNTLNTVTDVQGLLERLEALSDERTRLVVSFHNWLWQPFLKLAEKIGQREPQPAESWLTPMDISNLLDLAGWEVLKQGNRCIVPRKIPLLTSFSNRWISQLPIINQLCLTHWVVSRLSSKKRTESGVSVVIPARNEAGNIESALQRLPKLGCFTEVIFVEGHSNDSTWQKIEQVTNKYQGPFKIKKYKQTGKGKADAVWLGFEEAEGELLIILDADLTVRPEDLPYFTKAMFEGHGEFINGSRLVYPRSLQAMPLLNTIANRIFASLFSWLLKQSLKDTLCGTKVLWKKDYLKIKEGREYFGDFDPFGDFDLLFGASKLNLKIVEVPVRYQDRTYGSSNIAHIKEGLILAKMCFIAAKKLRFTR